ncbi:MAG: hypothetical protein M0R17_00085 [Candidatus Omnitrophica bacterium]|nr:hypothetical protein [Candidatus Omnitrophota bacterium]
MFNFLGKIPNNILVATSARKNSMAVIDFLSRSDRKCTMLHVDFKDDNSKERISFLKRVSKTFNIPLIVEDASKQNKRYNESKFIILNDYFTKYSPNFVITANVLEDVVVNYVMNSINCNPKIIQYRYKNIIRPYINTAQEEIDYWVTNKKVEFFNEDCSVGLTQDFIKKHMLSNCYKLNPKLNDMILNKVNEDFSYFLKNRNTNGR